MTDSHKNDPDYELRGEMYGMEAMNWYGWGSPIGLGLGVLLTSAGIGLLMLLLHLAGVVGR